MKTSRYFVLVLFLSGCFPMRFTMSPGASGQAVDAKTRSPISNAVATITPDISQPKSSTKTTLTDSNGGFTFMPEKEWGVYIIPMDMIAFRGSVSVVAPGYNPGYCDIKWSPGGPDGAHCGQIPLARQQ